MKKYGNPLNEFRPIAVSGYVNNLRAIAPEEVQSTYSVRKGDGKIFFNVEPTEENYAAEIREEFAPIDDSRYGIDQEAEEVRGQAVRSQMFDIYRRSESRRGGGPHDYVQLNEEMVTKDEEDQILSSMYTRLPDQVSISRRQAIRENGKREVWNDFDFEQFENGGLALNYRDSRYAIDDAKRLQDRKYIEMLKTNLEGNAQDYFSRQDLNMNNNTRTADDLFEDTAWKVDQNTIDRRPDFTNKNDPNYQELIFNLKTDEIISKDSTTFTPAKLLVKVNDLGATQAELTRLAEILSVQFGKGSLNSACSVRELLNLFGQAAELSSQTPQLSRLSKDEREMWGNVSILAKTSQLLLAPRAPQNTIAQISEKFINKEQYLANSLETGAINRTQYNLEMYKTMSKFHGAVMEVAKRYCNNGRPDENLVSIIGNAARIFELWSAGVESKQRIALDQREVNAMKEIIAFNTEIIEEAGYTRANKKSAPVELYLKAYASQLDNIMRFSSTFAKENPGVRVKYKHAYTKLAEQLDHSMQRSAKRALRENAKVLGVRYQEIMDDTRMPDQVKIDVLHAIDISISKADAMLRNEKKNVDPRTAYDFKNAADSLAVLNKEIDTMVNYNSKSKSQREDFIGKEEFRVNQNQRSSVRNEQRDFNMNRGDFSQKREVGELKAGKNFHSQRPQLNSRNTGYINELRISEGRSGRNESFTPGSMADIIANSVYTPAYGGASEFPTEMMYQHKW